MWLIKIFSEILWMVPSKISSGYLTLSIPLLDISKNFHNSYHYPFLIFLSYFTFSLFKVRSWSGVPLWGNCTKYFSLIKIPTVKVFPFSYFLTSRLIEKSLLEALGASKVVKIFDFHFFDFSRKFGLWYEKSQVTISWILSQ